MIKTHYPYTLTFFLLILVLFIPFLLRFKEPRLEIYPAILFPTGAELLKINDGSRFFQTYEIFGLKDTLAPLNKSEWMGEIPKQYYNYILKGNLGLEPYSSHFNFLIPSLKFEEKNYLDEASITETMTFFKNKLTEQGFKDSVLVVKSFKKKYSIESKQLQSQELIYEKTFILN
jgi:hypothetical protein